MATTIELYTMLKDKLGDVESRVLVETIEDTRVGLKTSY